MCTQVNSIPKVVGSIPNVAGHIFQARPVWIYTQSNITNIIKNIIIIFQKICIPHLRILCTFKFHHV